MKTSHEDESSGAIREIKGRPQAMTTSTSPVLNVPILVKTALLYCHQSCPTLEMAYKRAQVYSSARAGRGISRRKWQKRVAIAIAAGFPMRLGSDGHANRYAAATARKKERAQDKCSFHCYRSILYYCLFAVVSLNPCLFNKILKYTTPDWLLAPRWLEMLSCGLCGVTRASAFSHEAGFDSIFVS